MTRPVREVEPAELTDLDLSAHCERLHHGLFPPDQWGSFPFPYLWRRQQWHDHEYYERFGHHLPVPWWLLPVAIPVSFAGYMTGRAWDQLSEWCAPSRSWRNVPRWERPPEGVGFYAPLHPTGRGAQRQKDYP